MDVGREMDALIAERVMDWRRIEWEGGTTPMGRAPENVLSLVLEEVPHYSTDIAAAWQVVEHMRARGVLHIAADDSGYLVQITEINRKPVLIMQDADTAPPAICRAALAAMESA